MYFPKNTTMYVSDWVQFVSKIMDQSDIKEVVQLLEHALRSECWDSVEESVAYLREYLDDNEPFDGYVEE